jgi:hypothetical protein
MLCCELSEVLVNIENTRYSRGNPSKTTQFTRPHASPIGCDNDF